MSHSCWHGGAEQFVEHVAEPSFEHVQLGIPGRHARGPVVHDAPCLNGVFDRAAKAWPGAGHDIDIGRQFAECGTVVPRGAVPGHCGRIAQTPAGRNGQSLRWDALGFIVGHASRLILGETASPRNTRTA